MSSCFKFQTIKNTAESTAKILKNTIFCLSNSTSNTVFFTKHLPTVITKYGMAEEKEKPQTTWTFLVMMAMSTTFLLIVPVLALLALGFFVDKIFHTAPFYMLLGIALGLVGGMMNVYRLLQAKQKRKNNLNQKTSSRT